MELNTLFMLSFVLGFALLAQKITSKLGLPTVTGYVVIGVICGKSLFKIFQPEFVESVDIINDFALGIMAFTIGSELKKSLFKQLGKSIFFIAFFESFLAFVLVFIVAWLWQPDKMYQALVLGAVASATAPAATLVVLEQYKAKGPLTSTILAVVGIDDAVALIIFVFASAVAKGIMKGERLDLLSVMVHPIIEIGGALILGVAAAYLFNFLFKNTRNPENVLISTAAATLFLLGASTQMKLSELLAIMSFSAVLVNINPLLNNRSLQVAKYFGPLLYAMFFILAGSKLDFKLFPIIGVLGLLYLVARMIGKYSGATIGAFLGKAPAVVKKYVGMGLIPQVGVAVALAIIVEKSFGGGAYGQAGIDLSNIVINILLFTTIITEVVGPLLTKIAITKAGERND